MRTITIVLIVMLWGCEGMLTGAAKGALGLGSDGTSVDAELTIGDKREEVKTTVTAKKETVTTTTTNTAENLNISNITPPPECKVDYFSHSMVLIIGLLVGWLAFPSLRQMIAKRKK